MNFKNKKTITIVLVVLISLAVYLNAAFKKDAGDLGVTDSLLDAETTMKHPGEAKFVDGENGEGESAEVARINDYFSQARLLRTSAKDEALELLQTVVNDAQAAEETKQKALLDITTIAKSREQEANAEGLIRAKGFEEVMVYISSSGVNVAVQSEGLTKEQIAQIKDIVVGQTEYKAEKVKITEVK